MTIREWLIGLICDEERLEAYSKDPKKVIENSDLAPNQKRVLLSRDGQRIQHVIEFEENYDPRKTMHLIFPVQMHNHSDPTAS